MTYVALALLLALIPPPMAPGSPAPGSATPGLPPLHTIVTVKTSPYCNALADHFNAAFVPMLANNQSIDAIGIQLEALNGVFKNPTYASDYIVIRNKMMKQSELIDRVLPSMQREIDDLREAIALGRDPEASLDMTQTASQLQQAYDKQKQLAIDLHQLVMSMMQYDPLSVDQPPGGMDPNEIGMPEDMKDIKAYLRFDPRRDAMVNAESKAIDTAYATAQNHCTE